MRNRRKRRWSKYIFTDPGDGLEINRLNDGTYVSKATSSISMFDADNISIELIEPKNGHTFRVVSVMCEAKKVNRYRSKKLNGYKDLTRGR